MITSFKLNRGPVGRDCVDRLGIVMSRGDVGSLSYFQLTGIIDQVHETVAALSRLECVIEFCVIRGLFVTIYNDFPNVLLR